MNILIKVTGSISVYKICGVVSGLVKLGHDVKIAASESSLNFVGSATWEGLSSKKVFTNDFTPGQRMDHIYLNDWADLVVLAPASAQSLNSLSYGVGSSVVTTLFLARKTHVPYLIFPAMNPRMWRSSSVQKSVENLRLQEGVKVFKPESGPVACGHEGEGRLPSPSFILDQILKSEVKAKNVLVTFGGTTESIDGVRKITNFSSGTTGIEICKSLKADFNVTALASKDSLNGAQGLEGVTVVPYESSSDLSEKLRKVISENNYELVVHAAAVSDFIPENQVDQKISSSENLNIKFFRAAKILDFLKDWSKNKNCKVISFKLTHNQKPEDVIGKIKQQLHSGSSRFVVHNELSSINGDQHEYSIWDSESDAVIKKGLTKKDMVRDLLNICLENGGV